MSIIDLLQMSMTNLWRRKLRTILTVLGVVIGTASIVVMLSLGLGLKKSSMEQIERQGGLTTIDVYPNEGTITMYGNGDIISDNGNKVQRLDDKVVEQIRKLPHVKLVSPVLQIDVLAKCGIYQSNLTISGMTAEALQDMGLKIGKGILPSVDGPLQLFWGNMVQSDFYSSRGNDEMPSFDPMKDTIFYIFDTDAYYQSQNTGQGAAPVAPPKKYMIPVSGILEGGPEEYSRNSYNVFADLEVLKTYVKKVFKDKPIPGQPVGKKGKPFKELYYNRLYVRTDGIESVEEIQKAIRDMGLDASSNIEWLKQTQEQTKTIQMVLGGIGAVSLLVAAIGIANTMMMSIYERTKEIGILKVLGCDLSDIRKIFLLEAGGIGLIGGFAGLVLSYGVSILINMVTKNVSQQTISYIPVWLSVLTLLFAVLVGVVAGLFPALRAMRLSPLAALRN